MPWSKNGVMLLTQRRVRTSSPLALVCMQDVSSTTGYILNGKPYHRDKRVKIGSQKVGFGVVVLRDGDTIQIPGTTEGELVVSLDCPRDTS